MASLTEQLDALIAEHGLASICISRLANPGGGTFWHISAQAEAANGSREIGTSGFGTTDPAKGVADAINELNIKRIAPVAVVELAGLEQAA